MKRSQILSVAVVMIMALLISAIAVGTMPFWLTAFLVMPELVTPIKQYLTTRFMREASKLMFRGMRSPTIPVRTIEK